MTVLVTGATGLVGRALLPRLLRDDPAPDRTAIRLTTRRHGPSYPAGVEAVLVQDIADIDDWSPLLEDIDAIVHLAARVHVMEQSSAEAGAQYQRDNVDATARLARDAAACGVRRFIFLSSIKVLGESTAPGHAFTESSPMTLSEDPYARSKVRAEEALRDIAAQTGMEVVIVRSPLVYGPGVGANFGALLRLVARGWPLPLAGINNRRSLIGVENLVDFIARCLTHPAAAQQSFVISDGEDLSTSELVRRIASAQGTAARLFAVSPSLMLAGATVLGKRDWAARLIESLQVDATKARELLQWTSPVSVDEQLRRIVQVQHGSGSGFGQTAGR